MRMVPASLEDVLSGRDFYVREKDGNYSDIILCNGAYAEVMGEPTLMYTYSKNTCDVLIGGMYIYEHSLDQFNLIKNFHSYLWVDANTRAVNHNEHSALELLIRLDVLLDSYIRKKSESYICPMVDAHPDGVIGVLRDGYTLRNSNQFMYMNDSGKIIFQSEHKESPSKESSFLNRALESFQCAKEIAAKLSHHRQRQAA